MVNTQPKILFLDIETSPNIGFTWGKYEQNVIKFITESYLLSFAYKWQGEQTKALCLQDFNRYKRDKKDDGPLAAALRDLLSEADIVIAHNGDRFDLKKSHTFFIRNRLSPPSPYQTVDTLKEARKYFYFNSNKLDDLGEYLGVGRKIKTGGFELWERCLAGESKAWKEMVDYNKQDVDLLEQVYLRLRPYMRTHPSLFLLDACTACGGKVRKQGTKMTTTGPRQKLQCGACGKWSTGKITKEPQLLR